MANRIECLIDTNIFFRIFKSDKNLQTYIESLDLAVCATVYIECIQGSKSNQEKRKIMNYLDNFPLLPITRKISLKSIELIDTYSNSHGLLLADAQIAATTIENDLTLISFNKSDFEFVKDLKFQIPVNK